MPPLFRWIGRTGTGPSLLIFFAAAAIGAVGTMATNSDPGFLLGFMIIVGSCVAALCVRRKSVYLLIPLPALTYLVLAIVTGYAHDHALGTSTSALASDFTQWLGGGFTGIGLATVFVLLIFGARALASRQLVSGHFPTSAQRPSGERFPRTPMSPPSRADRGPRGDRPPWENPDQWGDDDGRDRGRGTRDSRDPWGGRDENDSGAPRAREAYRREDSPRDDRARDDRGRDDRGRGARPRDDPGRDGRRDERGRGDRRPERDAWYEQPRSGSRGRAADNDQPRTRAMPSPRDVPGVGPGRDAAPGRTPRRPNEDRWRG